MDIDAQNSDRPSRCTMYLQVRKSIIVLVRLYFQTEIYIMWKMPQIYHKNIPILDNKNEEKINIIVNSIASLRI